MEANSDKLTATLEILKDEMLYSKHLEKCLSEKGTENEKLLKENTYLKQMFFILAVSVFIFILYIISTK